MIIGSALDIVQSCGVPRFLFVDFPLGNPCGKPWDTPMQQRILAQALELFDTVREPMTTRVSPERWDNSDWKNRYMEVNDHNRAELARKGIALRKRRAKRVPRTL